MDKNNKEKCTANPLAIIVGNKGFAWVKVWGNYQWAYFLQGFGKSKDYRDEHPIVSQNIVIGYNSVPDLYPKFPSIGRFWQGHGEITTEHEEHVDCLEGVLNFDVGDGFKEFKPGETAIIPVKTIFRYDQNQEALFVCEYRWS